MRYLLIVLLIVVTSLLYVGAIVLIGRATEETEFYARGMPLSLGIFCFLFGAVSTIMLLETTFRAARCRVATEDSIGRDWSPLIVVLVAVVSPVLLYSLLLIYLYIVALPPIVYVPIGVLALFAILILLRWFYSHSRKT